MPGLLESRRQLFETRDAADLPFWSKIGEVVVAQSFIVRRLKPQGWEGRRLELKGLYFEPQWEEWGYVWGGLSKPTFNHKGEVAVRCCWQMCTLSPTPQSFGVLPDGWRNSPYQLEVKEVAGYELIEYYGGDILPVMKKAVYNAQHRYDGVIRGMGYYLNEMNYQDYIHDLMLRNV